MPRCYYHPKIEAVALCQGCKMTVCCHCLENDLCPECAKLRRFVQRGYSGDRPPRLVEPAPARRSVTMELMLERLQRQVFADDAATARPAGLGLPRKLIDTEARAGKSRGGKSQAGKPQRGELRKAPVKARRGMSYGFLMPSVAPLIRVSRSPISRMAVLMLIAFSLGTFFARQGSVSATVAETDASRQATEVLEAPIQAAPVSVQYKPVYIHVPVREGQALVSTPRAGMPAAQRAAVTPAAQRQVAAPAAPAAPSMAYPIASRQKFAPEASASQPVLEAAQPASLDLAFPHPGNIVRSTSTLRVRIANPGKLALLNLAVDGQPIKAIPEISENLEVPFDTTAFANGDHAIQILAMEADGTIRSSQTVPVTIRN